MGGYRLLGWISKKETTKSSVWSCLLRKFTVEVFILKTAIREGNIPIGCFGVKKLDFCTILMIWPKLHLSVIISFLCTKYSRTTFLYPLAYTFIIFLNVLLACLLACLFVCLLACLLACLLEHLIAWSLYFGPFCSEYIKVYIFLILKK